MQQRARSKGYVRLAALTVAFAIAAGACTNGTQPQGEGDEEIVPGGTLRLNMLSGVTAAFDPQKEWSAAAWELYRCCLLRTLLSYPGLPASEGGGELVPDLAAALPTVSDDGLRWTFTLRRGVRYAPPFEATEIVAQDFLRAMEREADPETAAGGYGFFYSVIEGFDEFAEGEARRISGMRALDDHTLRIRLTEPTGHFGFLMAMAATAPIPEGAAGGHPEDYGRFLVASGPYMFEGSRDLDFSLPAEDQKPVAGYRPGRSIALVRNPSWDLDDIRPAHVDQISIRIGGTIEDAVRLVDAGDLDMQFDASAPSVQVRKYLADPQLQDEVFINQTDTLRYLTMNLAAPPFDDVHVRKAVNLAVDKAGLRRTLGGPTLGEIAGHIFPDGLIADLLADYDPYATPRDRGDLEGAMAEMALSDYDENGDGVCDARACRRISTVTERSGPYPAQAALIRESLEPLGLQLEIEALDRGPMVEKVFDPASRTALSLALVWGRDYVDGSTFGEPLFGSASIGTDAACCNTSLVGATLSQLEEFGYEPTTVPSVDAEILACDRTPVGAERFRCWADLDRTLMEDVVPFVPYLFDTYARTVSDRVVNYTFDQFAGLPALDHIALAGGGEEG